MLDEHVPFLEGIGIEQQFDALARGQLALGVLRVDAALAAAGARRRALLFELLQDFLHPLPRFLSLIFERAVVTIRTAFLLHCEAASHSTKPCYRLANGTANYFNILQSRQGRNRMPRQDRGGSPARRALRLRVAAPFLRLEQFVQQRRIGRLLGR